MVLIQDLIIYTFRHFLKDNDKIYILISICLCRIMQEDHVA